MYLSLFDVNRLVLERAGPEIRDVLLLREQLAVAMDYCGIVGVVLLVKAVSPFKFAWII
jgi:hypothetical protein